MGASRQSSAVPHLPHTGAAPGEQAKRTMTVPLRDGCELQALWIVELTEVMSVLATQQQSQAEGEEPVVKSTNHERLATTMPSVKKSGRAAMTKLVPSTAYSHLHRNVLYRYRPIPVRGRLLRAEDDGAARLQSTSGDPDQAAAAVTISPSLALPSAEDGRIDDEGTEASIIDSVVDALVISRRADMSHFGACRSSDINDSAHHHLGTTTSGIDDDDDDSSEQQQAASHNHVAPPHKQHGATAAYRTRTFPMFDADDWFQREGQLLSQLPFWRRAVSLATPLQLDAVGLATPESAEDRVDGALRQSTLPESLLRAAASDSARFVHVGLRKWVTVILRVGAFPRASNVVARQSGGPAINTMPSATPSAGTLNAQATPTDKPRGRRALAAAADAILDELSPLVAPRVIVAASSTAVARDASLAAPPIVLGDSHATNAFSVDLPPPYGGGRSGHAVAPPSGHAGGASVGEEEDESAAAAACVVRPLSVSELQSNWQESGLVAFRRSKAAGQASAAAAAGIGSSRILGTPPLTSSDRPGLMIGTAIVSGIGRREHRQGELTVQWSDHLSASMNSGPAMKRVVSAITLWHWRVDRGAPPTNAAGLESVVGPDVATDATLTFSVGSSTKGALHPTCGITGQDYDDLAAIASAQMSTAAAKGRKEDKGRHVAAGDDGAMFSPQAAALWVVMMLTTTAHPPPRAAPFRHPKAAAETAPLIRRPLPLRTQCTASSRDSLWAQCVHAFVARRAPMGEWWATPSSQRSPNDPSLSLRLLTGVCLDLGASDADCSFLGLLLHHGGGGGGRARRIPATLSPLQSRVTAVLASAKPLVAAADAAVTTAAKDPSNVNESIALKRSVASAAGGKKKLRVVHENNDDTAAMRSGGSLAAAVTGAPKPSNNNDVESPSIPTAPHRGGGHSSATVVLLVDYIDVDRVAVLPTQEATNNGGNNNIAVVAAAPCGTVTTHVYCFSSSIVAPCRSTNGGDTQGQEPPLTPSWTVDTSPLRLCVTLGADEGELAVGATSSMATGTAAGSFASGSAATPDELLLPDGGEAATELKSSFSAWLSTTAAAPLLSEGTLIGGSFASGPAMSHGRLLAPSSSSTTPGQVVGYSSDYSGLRSEGQRLLTLSPHALSQTTTAAAGGSYPVRISKAIYEAATFSHRLPSIAAVRIADGWITDAVAGDLTTDVSCRVASPSNRSSMSRLILDRVSVEPFARRSAANPGALKGASPSTGIAALLFSHRKQQFASSLNDPSTAAWTPGDAGAISGQKHCPLPRTMVSRTPLLDCRDVRIPSASGEPAFSSSFDPVVTGPSKHDDDSRRGETGKPVDGSAVPFRGNRLTLCPGTGWSVGSASLYHHASSADAIPPLSTADVSVTAKGDPSGPGGIFGGNGSGRAAASLGTTMAAAWLDAVAATGAAGVGAGTTGASPAAPPSSGGFISSTHVMSATMRAPVTPPLVCHTVTIMPCRLLQREEVHDMITAKHHNNGQRNEAANNVPTGGGRGGAVPHPSPPSAFDDSCVDGRIFFECNVEIGVLCDLSPSWATVEQRRRIAQLLQRQAAQLSTTSATAAAANSSPSRSIISGRTAPWDAVSLTAEEHAIVTRLSVDIAVAAAVATPSCSATATFDPRDPSGLPVDHDGKGVKANACEHPAEDRSSTMTLRLDAFEGCDVHVNLESSSLTGGGGPVESDPGGAFCLWSLRGDAEVRSGVDSTTGHPSGGLDTLSWEAPEHLLLRHRQRLVIRGRAVLSAPFPLSAASSTSAVLLRVASPRVRCTLHFAMMPNVPSPELVLPYEVHRQRVAGVLDPYLDALSAKSQSSTTTAATSAAAREGGGSADTLFPFPATVFNATASGSEAKKLCTELVSLTARRTYTDAIVGLLTGSDFLVACSQAPVSPLAASSGDGGGGATATTATSGGGIRKWFSSGASSTSELAGGHSRNAQLLREVARRHAGALSPWSPIEAFVVVCPEPSGGQLPGKPRSGGVGTVEVISQVIPAASATAEQRDVQLFAALQVVSGTSAFGGVSTGAVSPAIGTVSLGMAVSSPPPTADLSTTTGSSAPQLPLPCESLWQLRSPNNNDANPSTVVRLAASPNILIPALGRALALQGLPVEGDPVSRAAARALFASTSSAPAVAGGSDDGGTQPSAAPLLFVLPWRIVAPNGFATGIKIGDEDDHSVPDVLRVGEPLEYKCRRVMLHLAMLQDDDDASAAAAGIEVVRGWMLDRRRNEHVERKARQRREGGGGIVTWF